MGGMSQSFTDKLAARIKETGSALCVGLDPRPGMDDLEVIPALLRKVVKETAPYAAAFKPNIAYFEAMGLRGLEILEDLLPDMPKDVPVVLDAKRGDIGETQKYYAHAYFERLGVDAVTLSPFMGYDTLEPFLNYEGKGVYLLAVTSNPGSVDVERQELAGGRRVLNWWETWCSALSGKAVNFRRHGGWFDQCRFQYSGAYSGCSFAHSRPGCSRR